jgi:hypothetical protein
LGHTVGIIPKLNIKIIEKGKIDTTNTQIYDHPPTWLGTGTSIKSAWIKLVFFCFSFNHQHFDQL